MRQTFQQPATDMTIAKLKHCIFCISLTSLKTFRHLMKSKWIGTLTRKFRHCRGPSGTVWGCQIQNPHCAFSVNFLSVMFIRKVLVTTNWQNCNRPLVWHTGELFWCLNLLNNLSFTKNKDNLVELQGAPKQWSCDRPKQTMILWSKQTMILWSKNDQWYESARLPTSKSNSKSSRHIQSFSSYST